MSDPGLPLTTGEGNTGDPELELLCFNRAHRELEAECGRLREQAEQWERRCEQAYERFDAASNDAMQANLKVGRLREQLDAARQAQRDALLLLGQASGSESLSRAKAVLRAALGVEGEGEA